MTNPKGYGHFSIGKKGFGAHRRKRAEHAMKQMNNDEDQVQ